MSTTEPLCTLLGINPAKLSVNELKLLEADLFTRVCEALINLFKTSHHHFFRALKFTKHMEESMLESKLTKLVINDILSSNEYTLDGIACYANVPEDVLDEIVLERNTAPSAVLLRRIIELHRSVRRELYHAMMKQIANEYLLSLSDDKANCPS